MAIKTIEDVFKVARRAATAEEVKELNALEDELQKQNLLDFDPTFLVATYWDVGTIKEGLDHIGSNVELTDAEAHEHLMHVIKEMDWGVINERIDDYVYYEIHEEE